MFSGIRLGQAEEGKDKGGRWLWAIWRFSATRE